MVVFDALLLLQTNVHDHFGAFHRGLSMSFLVFEEFLAAKNWIGNGRTRHAIFLWIFVCPHVR